MKTVEVTVNQLAQMVGTTPAEVRKVLRDGNLYYPIVRADKKGKSWSIHILEKYTL